MAGEQDLRDTLNKIEALLAGASTAGEKAAAEAAADRLRAGYMSLETMASLTEEHTTALPSAAD